MKFMSKYVPRFTLETIYKSYVRSQLEYADVIYHHPPLDGKHLSFCKLNPLMSKVESVQYRAALVITGAWNGTSRKKLYKELGWESLSQRRWQRRMSLFWKIINNQTPLYLKKCLQLRFGYQPIDFNPRTLNFLASFFPSCVFSWNNDNLITPITRTYDATKFKTFILNRIKPQRNEIYGVLDKKGLRYLSQLRLDLNPLKYYKSKHKFLDTDGPVCKCLNGIEDIEHFLLNCHEFTDIRNTLLSNVSQKLNVNLNSYSPKKRIRTLLYGIKKYKYEENRYILNQTIAYIIKSKRFDKQNDDNNHVIIHDDNHMESDNDDDLSEY
jgi:hypothetical protein